MSPLVAMPSGWEWLIVLAIVILVFGAAKLPELARGTGQALRIFKAETKGLKDDDEQAKDKPVTNELPPAQAKPTEPPVEGEIVEPRRDTGAS